MTKNNKFMKRKLFSILGLAVLGCLVVAGCDKDEDETFDTSKYNTIITVKSSVAKTQYNTSTHGVDWVQSDKISVIRGNDDGETNYFVDFDLQWPIEDEARFYGLLPQAALNNGEAYYAIYPNQTGLSIKGNRLTCVPIRHEQTLTVNSFGPGDNTAVGANNTTDMFFYNIGALAKIKVVGDMSIKSIKITNNATSDNTLSGQGVINMDNHSIVQFCDETYNNVIASTTTAIDVTTGKYFYIVLPPCTLNDYTVTITDGSNCDHEFVVNDANMIFDRAHVVDLGSFEVENQNFFTINDNGDKVIFSPGNLRYNNGTWEFVTPQYASTYTSNSTEPSNNVWEHFSWSTTTTNYGMTTSNDIHSYTGTFKDWGENIGTGWRTPTKAEWIYVFEGNNRHNRVKFSGADYNNVRFARASVNGVNGIILFPDGPSLTIDLSTMNAPSSINIMQMNDEEASWDVFTSYSATDWNEFEAVGCVFLPAAGIRASSEGNASDILNVVLQVGVTGSYWSATGNTNGQDAYSTHFGASYIVDDQNNGRWFGRSVRLVRQQQ